MNFSAGVADGDCHSGTSALLMFRQKRHSAEGFAARGARVLFDVAVSLEMSSEVAAVGESAIAMLTAEGFFAGVSPDVSLKKPRPGEGFATEMTLAGKCVSPDVHLEGAHTDVNFFAVFAGE